MSNRTFAYVCAPVNQATGFVSGKLKEYSKALYELGYLPICPCMMFSRFLSDSVPEQRNARKAMSLELLRRCRVLVLCSNEVTEEMEAEIMLAKRLGIVSTTLAASRKSRFRPRTVRMRSDSFLGTCYLDNALHWTNEHWIWLTKSARKGVPLNPFNYKGGRFMRKRNIQVMLHLDSKEYQALMKKVKRTGLSRETYLRQLINGFVPKELPPPDYHSMMRELNAIGNSINQIAARANATGFFLAEDYACYMDEFRRVTLEIQKAVTLPVPL